MSSRIAATALLAFVLGCGAEPIRPRPFDLVIEGGRVMDPESGLDAIRHLGIRDGRIDVIDEEPLFAERRIDARGLVVAPGFIDLHVHGQHDESFTYMIRDGVTTGLELEVGTANVEGWYRRRQGGQRANYGVSIGHIPVRMRVLGDSGDFLPSGPAKDTAATAAQMAEMGRLMREGLEQGAIGVGLGLAYTPGAVGVELGAMMEVAAETGSTVFIHVRDGLEGLEEALEAATKSGASLHVVHANSSGGTDTARFLARIEAARASGQDVTTEAYPYGAGATRIESAVYDDWEQWPDSAFERFQWTRSGERLTRRSFARLRALGGTVISHDRTEAMTREAIEHPLTMIASDGGISGGRGHPRGSGSFSRVLGRYVREQGALTLMDALRKMTLEPARRLQSAVPAMRAKGRVRVGSDADLTLFDPLTVVDRSTYESPAVPPAGIPYVIVGGVVVVDEGELVRGAWPGRPIRR